MYGREETKRRNLGRAKILLLLYSVHCRFASFRQAPLQAFQAVMRMLGPVLQMNSQRRLRPAGPRLVAPGRLPITRWHFQRAPPTLRTIGTVRPDRPWSSLSWTGAGMFETKRETLRHGSTR